tara:strand:+ start:4851 stop:5057 length:207 start_codon:yes stop_codon:yes gene_type:complete
MDVYIVLATVDGIDFRRKVTASSEDEALAMCKNHLKWTYPTKNVEMGEVTRETNPAKKRLKGKWPHEN